jgi:hypothetical protein
MDSVKMLLAAVITLLCTCVLLSSKPSNLMRIHTDTGKSYPAHIQLDRLLFLQQQHTHPGHESHNSEDCGVQHANSAGARAAWHTG